MELVPYTDEEAIRHLEAASDAMAGTSLPFLKFQKGDYFLGQDLEEIPLGTRFVVNVPACAWGWMRWVDNRPAERRMVRMVSGQPRALRDELGHLDPDLWAKDDEGPRDPWARSFELPMREVEGRQREMIFTGSSRGMETCVQEFVRAYVNARRGQQGQAIPIVALQVTRYTHSKYGIIKTPKLEVISWITQTSGSIEAPTKSNGDQAKAIEKGLGAEAKAEKKALAAEFDDEIPF